MKLGLIGIAALLAGAVALASSAVRERPRSHSNCVRVDVEAGVGFIECDDGTNAIVTLQSHCVHGIDGVRSQRRIECDDGLLLDVTGGANGQCALLTRDVSMFPEPLN